MRRPFHVDYILRKDEVESPQEGCLEPSAGRPRGQLRNWRATLPDGSCMHVLEFKSVYVVHRDRANLNDSVLRHVALDEPRAMVYLLWLPLAELARLAFRAAYRKRLRARGSPCAALYDGAFKRAPIALGPGGRRGVPAGQGQRAG